MLKKLGIPALLLAAALTAAPEKAAIRFGVGIGGPVYVPAYPYYSYAYPGYYGYYGRPYFYGYYGHGWRWHHHYRYWRRWR